MALFDPHELMPLGCWGCHWMPQAMPLDPETRVAGAELRDI